MIRGCVSYRPHSCGYSGSWIRIVYGILVYVGAQPSSCSYITYEHFCSFLWLLCFHYSLCIRQEPLLVTSLLHSKVACYRSSKPWARHHYLSKWPISSPWNVIPLGTNLNLLLFVYMKLIRPNSWRWRVLHRETLSERYKVSRRYFH